MLLRSVGYTKYLSFNPYDEPWVSTSSAVLEVPHSCTQIRIKPPILRCCENHLKVVYNLVLCKIRETLFLRAFGWDHTNSVCNHRNPGEHIIGGLLYFPASCTETH